MTQHINRQFDRDLETVRSGVMRMATLVEAQIRAALAAYLEADVAAARAVIDGDARVNELELAIDHELGQLIVRRQPAASDLRLALAASKIVTDLERIGDEAAKIARVAQAEPLGSPVASRDAGIDALSETATGALHRALDAFARMDAADAARVCAEDAAIDDQFRAVLREVVTGISSDARTTPAALRALWVAKAFERIGDHARNIAEHVIYIVKGHDVRHVPLAELQRQALGS
jgi:phosphate transport system protein